MADRRTKDQERAAQELQELLVRILAHPMGELMHRDQGVDLDLEPVQASVEAAIDLTLTIAEALKNSAPLPHSLTVIALDAFKSLNQKIEDLVRYAPADMRGTPPRQHRATTITETERAIGEFFQKVAPVQAYVLRMSTAGETGAITAAREQATSILSDIKDVVAKVREQAGGAGVSQHAGHFSTAGTDHAKAAKRWLWATVSLTFATAAAAAVNLYVVLEEPAGSDVSPVELVAAKVILFTVLLSGVVWSGRNYRANRHNEVVNRHRQNALNSFETFAAAASDEGTKNAVLLQATQAIFSPQPSGFGQGEGDVTATSAQLVELVRHISPQKQA